MRHSKLAVFAGVVLIALLVNTAYVSSFADPTIFYMTNALLHLVLGVVLTVAVALLLWRRPEWRRGFGPTGALLAVAFATGAFLAIRGNVTQHRPALIAHIAAAAVGLLAMLPWLARRAAEHGGRWRRFRRLVINSGCHCD